MPGRLVPLPRMNGLNPQSVVIDALTNPYLDVGQGSSNHNGVDSLTALCAHGPSVCASPSFGSVPESGNR